MGVVAIVCILVFIGAVLWYGARIEPKAPS